MMDQLHLLIFLSVSMLIGSFVSGLVPLAFRLSDSKSRLLALLGSGILVGTALAIIIPEGVDSLYRSQSLEQNTASSVPGSSIGTLSSASPFTQMVDKVEVEYSKTSLIGLSLVIGFVLMLFIDQFSTYQNSQEGYSSHETNQRPSHEYALANQESDDDEYEVHLDRNRLPKRNSAHDDHNDNRNNAANCVNIDIGHDEHNTGTSIDNVQLVNDSEKIPIRDTSTGLSHRKTSGANPTGSTPTLGLVIHASADGVALGAAATTAHRDVEMIIFLAIMLHKAPAAFSLVVFLMHRGLKHSTIRRHLLAFSLSAPIAALVTYFGLSQSGKEALRRNNATGIAMLFSAGTFLYVATVHVLPELVNHKLLKPKEMLFLVGGAFLPLLLAQGI